VSPSNACLDRKCKECKDKNICSFYIKHKEVLDNE